MLALKPMNCPGHVQIFKQGLKSYRDLLAAFRNTVPATGTSRLAPCTVSCGSAPSPRTMPTSSVQKNR